MKWCVSVLLSVVLSVPAFGAGATEALRASARSTRAQVTHLRASQLEARTELSRLSARIETLKGQAKGRLLPGGELDGALKQSQVLSEALTGLAQQLSVHEEALESAQAGLLEALSQELTLARAEFDRESDRAARRRLIVRMKEVRTERESLRAALPLARLPTLAAPPASDDPTELLEQADLLRDNEEKLRRELRLLDQRLKERREELELDRRVQRFMGEEAMFDDQDRRLRLQRTAVAGSGSTTGAGQNSARAGAEVPVGGMAMPAAAGPSFEGAGGPASGSGPGVGAGNAAEGAAVKLHSGSDAQPQLGVGRRIADGDGEGDDVPDLEAQRTRVRDLAEAIRRRAEALERRAAELK